MLNWVKKKKKNEPLAWGAVVKFDVDGGYSVHAKLGTKCEWAWCVTVYRGRTMYWGGDVVARRQFTVWPSCPDELTLEYLQSRCNRGYLDELAEKREWLLATRVPDDLWDVTVSASDEFLVTELQGYFGQPFRYCIRPRRECGEVDQMFKSKEFHTDYFKIKSPKDFPPEKIKEKWEEWHYPNEYDLYSSEEG
jgi:hypothetical protein